MLKLDLSVDLMSDFIMSSFATAVKTFLKLEPENILCENYNLNLQRFWCHLRGTHWFPSSQWVLTWLSLIIQIISVNYSNTIDEIWKDIGFVPPDCCLWYWDDGFVLQFLSRRNNQDLRKGLWISELLGAKEAVGVECFIMKKQPDLYYINLWIKAPNYGWWMIL